MDAKSPLDRAIPVLSGGKYFALAVVDDRGPWVATLAYVILQPRFLCFFSQADSRHGKALAQETAIAGVIYDSHCTPETAESIQFSGQGVAVRDRETIAAVMNEAAKRDGAPSPSDKAIDEQLNSTSTLLFKVSVDDAYVLDQELFTRDGLDGRLPVDARKLFAALTDGK